MPRVLIPCGVPKVLKFVWPHIESSDRNRAKRQRIDAQLDDDDVHIRKKKDKKDKTKKKKKNGKSKKKDKKEKKELKENSEQKAKKDNSA